MQPIDYTAFAQFRAELHHDYAPANAQERLLINEVATCWMRLEQARRREDLFFDLQKTAQAIRCGQPLDAFEEDGGEVRMWLDEPHKAYDQVLRSIRDAGIAFDRAVRRLEAVRDKRLTRERALDKRKPRESVQHSASQRVNAAGQANTRIANVDGPLADHPSLHRERSQTRSPDTIHKAA